MHNPIGNIVYAMSSENIESTICDGRWLMKEKEILVLDESKLLDEVKEQAKKIREKANIKLNSNFTIIK